MFRGCYTLVLSQQGTDWEILAFAPTLDATGMSLGLDSILITQAAAHGLTLESYFQLTCLLETPFMQAIGSLI